MPKPKARTSAPKTSAKKPKDTAKSARETSESSTPAIGAVPPSGNGHISAAASPAGAMPANKTTEIAEKIKELVRLAQEQGYLTYGDVNDALPDTLVSPEELDEIYIKLRNLEVEKIGRAHV
jgi:RNA polymerase primary sigma factor